MEILGDSVVKKPSRNAGDWGLVPGSGRSPGEGKWQPTPVLLPGEPHGGGAWWATGHGVAKSDTIE